jgi:sec-independent protein translocase protein TatA
MELIIVLGIVVIIFGAGKLADLGGALGKGIREFREQTKTDDEPKAESLPAATAAPAVPAAPVATTTGCPSCGTSNPPSQQFCGSCGAALKTPVTTA